ncbi:GNAT family N-acetyltransferase [Deinococcus yavapaiensis]|uniref:Acetyltransferase (GNAT) family protein n=1 Tax=Deinococcus yavapaiensis KR-236 TaxID=694435 RepID=A0A318SJ02_9DEIO|nr:GNAT family N-acetyltransferase [Deinococcus yavapaiensis]PYE51903.1 acetyltransferase (GNAT) family protein [Deinococcus yavapaiensis KR-236]
MTSVTLRRATISDLAVLVTLGDAAGNAERRRRIEETLATRETVLALRGDEAVGYGVLGTFFDRPFVSLVYVSPPHRRRGIAEALVRHFGALDAPKVFSSTNLGNAAMHALFRKLGWIAAGMVDHLDEGDPEVIYVRVTSVQ